MTSSSTSGTPTASPRSGVCFVPATMTTGRTPTSAVPETAATVGAASVTHSGNGDGRLRQRETLRQREKLPNFILPILAGRPSCAAFPSTVVLRGLSPTHATRPRPSAIITRKGPPRSPNSRGNCVLAQFWRVVAQRARGHHHKVVPVRMRDSCAEHQEIAQAIAARDDGRAAGVAPAELEALLLTHPAVLDAAVVPSPDAEAGEVPKAFIVTQAEVDLAELESWVARQVAPYKRIRRLEVVAQIPRTPSGKILRRVLIEQERAAATPADI